MKTIPLIATASLLAFLSCSILGQTSAAPAAFEVASLTPSKSAVRMGGVRSRAGRLTGTHLTLKHLLAFAYDLHSSQFAGPDWIETEGYDINAQAKSPATRTQLREMLQVLLEDRFKMTSHRETRELPVYWLVVAEGGPKLRDPKEEAVFNAALAGKSPFKPGMSAMYTNKDLPGFAEYLGKPLDRPVLDKTGIEGRYWFQLEWEGGPESVGLESLLTALPEQLGLELEENRAPLEVVVIDQVEKP